MKKHLYLILLTFFFLLIGCESKEEPIEFEEYTGRELNIGVVGDAPDVIEEQINFLTIDLGDLLITEGIENLDAIFIMQDYLICASEAEYADVYKSSGIPFFFIESDKSYLPFVMEDFTYDNSFTVGEESYATGVYYTEDGEMTTWGFGLYNHEKNEKNIKEVYSRIFKKINEVK